MPLLKQLSHSFSYCLTLICFRSPSFFLSAEVVSRTLPQPYKTLHPTLDPEQFYVVLVVAECCL